MTMADGKKSSGKGKALTQLEKDVYETFGMLPNEDRLSFLPRYKSGEGFIAPELLYDLAKVIQSPRTAMYSELGPEEALNMALGVMGGSSVGAAPRGALQMGIAKPTLEPKRRAALMDAERALPLNLPRAPAKSQQEIAAHAERVGRQMLGEHVRSGKPKDTQNLAGRSLKESQRLKNLQYELEPLKELPPIETVQPRIGDINVAVPGDTSISDLVLKSIEGEPIGSVQQGGSLFGLGKLDRDDPLFWASNEGPAQIMQDKITDVAGLFEPERVLAQHLAMGRVANNFAQHFADASLRAIDYSKLSAKDMNTFDNVIAGGYTKKNQKTGEVQYITFPHWPGIADPEGALAAMKADPELRKWFLSRMKTPKLTQATNMPNALDIEWAITHPELRNMEVNLTGHSVGEMVPGAKLADDPDHETYLKGIRGRFLGQQENLTPFAISYPDATQHIATTQRPQDFTGTIQKVFPHQRVDQQYIDEYGEYMRQLNKFLTGRKKGGEVTMADGGQTFPLQRPELVTEVSSRKPKHPLAELLGKGVGAVHEFASKPFGYENPPGEMASSLLGLPAVATTLERFAYGEPLTRGSGETFGLRPETTEALMTALPVAGEAARLGTKGAKALAPTAREMLEAGLERAVAPTKMYVMKPKGGNWMAGDVEREVTDPLKIKIVGQAPEERIALHERLLQDPELNQDQIDRVKYHLELTKNDAAINNWVDKKLNRYVKNEMGTTEDPIRLGIERRAAAADKLKAENQAKLRKMEADIARAKAAGKDTTLSRRDLEAAREKFADEQYVASQGLYHSPIPEGGWDDFDVWQPSVLESKRQEAGFPGRNMATHPAAKFWEVNSDINLSNVAAKEYQNPGLQGTPLVEDNPWIQKLDPEAKINLIGQSAHVDLDFPHMIDELRNAMSPDTPLPASLRVTAKDLEKMTPDDVSALVGKINAWRNVQKTKSNTQIANNPATHLFKEYPPENNPKGVSWRQIKLPEGYPEAEARKFVKEATQYEGDMMRHCVGGAGHCEPLLRGDVEIYTLRDAKGEPHVTIEVKPADVSRAMAQLTPDERQYLVDTVKNKYFNGVMPGRSNEDEFWRMLDHEYIQVHGKPPPAILEIKGKNNNKPKDEYIPFVQDFIKSGNWSNVGDFHNTNLIHLSPSSDMAKLLREAGSKNIPKYLTQEEANVLSRWAAKGGELPEGFANGGAVDYESRFNEMLQNHIGMAEGGAVDYESRFNQMLQQHVGMADGGEVNQYNSDPDMSDGGLFVAAPAFKNGGAVKSIWTVN